MSKDTKRKIKIAFPHLRLAYQYAKVLQGRLDHSTAAHDDVTFLGRLAEGRQYAEKIVAEIRAAEHKYRMAAGSGHSHARQVRQVARWGQTPRAARDQRAHRAEVYSGAMIPTRPKSRPRVGQYRGKIPTHIMLAGDTPAIVVKWGRKWVTVRPEGWKRNRKITREAAERGARRQASDA